MRRRQLRSQKPLRMETLDARMVLSANPLGAGEVPETIILEQGDLVFVFGSDEDNVIQVDLGTQTHSLTVDDDVRMYDADTVRQIVVYGGVGNDEVEVNGTELADRVHVEGDEAELLGPRVRRSLRYQVRVRTAETIRLTGGEGSDVAQFFDSSGDDTISMRHDSTTYDNSLGETMQLSGFERVEAFAENGGNDQVNFYDTVGDDRFVAKETFSYMVGDGFSNYARGFERVDAFHEEGGSDEARLFDSAGDDVLTASPTEVMFEVGDTIQVAHNFPVTRAIASEGNDTGELLGQEFVDDVFVWDPVTAFMNSTGNLTDGANPPIDFEPITVVNLAVGFDVIEARGNGTGDRADLYGSDGDDQFFSVPGLTEMSLPDETTIVEAGNFAVVRAFAGDGFDRAELTDSAFNDRYVGRENAAYMQTPGFLSYVSGFDEIDAVSRNGGFDTALVEEYRGPRRDYLIHDDLQFLVYGPERSERVYGFDQARGVGEDAGWQILRAIVNPFTLAGAHDNSPTGVPETDEIEELQARLAEAIFFVDIDEDETLNGTLFVSEEVVV